MSEKRGWAQRGIVLLVSLMIVSGLTILTTLGMTRSMTDLLAARQMLAREQALHLAEAGLDDLLNPRGAQNGSLNLAQDLLDGTWSVTSLSGTLPNGGQYAVEVTTQLLHNPLMLPRLTGGDLLLVSSEGTPASSQLSRTVEVVVEVNALWEYALLGTGPAATAFAQPHFLKAGTIDAIDFNATGRYITDPTDPRYFTQVLPGASKLGDKTLQRNVLRVPGGGPEPPLFEVGIQNATSFNINGPIYHQTAYQGPVLQHYGGTINGNVTPFNSPPPATPPLPLPLPGDAVFGKSLTIQPDASGTYHEVELCQETSTAPVVVTCAIPLRFPIEEPIKLPAAQYNLETFVIRTQSSEAPVPIYWTGNTQIYTTTATFSGSFDMRPVRLESQVVDLSPAHLQFILQDTTPDNQWVDQPRMDVHGSGQLTAVVYGPEAIVDSNSDPADRGDFHFAGAFIVRQLNLGNATGATSSVHYELGLNRGPFTVTSHSWRER